MYRLDSKGTFPESKAAFNEERRTSAQLGTYPYPKKQQRMLNALTIDVEDYYQVSGFESQITFESWPQYESRVLGNTWRILELLHFHKVKATFFVLGWIAEHYPQVVLAIRQEGHEIASHGYRHRLIYNMSQEEFRKDTERSKGILEDLCGIPVIGYRAPSYSIIQETLWALDILAELGFQYDSSIFPIHHDRYGIPTAGRFSYDHSLSNGRKLLEFPLSTVKIYGRNIPVAGGGYLRLLPYPFIRWGIRQINEKEGQPAIIYLHPWEIDPGQPKVQGSWLSRFRHYVNLDKTESRLKLLLHDFSFGTLQMLMQQSERGVESPLTVKEEKEPISA
jgi:polysaccharide deacetylase family protein (PEP-CTERM system associated)